MISIYISLISLIGLISIYGIFIVVVIALCLSAIIVYFIGLLIYCYYIAFVNISKIIITKIITILKKDL
jgi:hypothetical protein